MSGVWHRRLLGLHRWIGGACALFLVVLSVTGLALNHNARLGLDRRMIQTDWVLAHYGMAFPRPEVAIVLNGDHAAIIGGDFWWKGGAVAPLENIVGVSEGQGWLLIGGGRQALLLTPEGELIDILQYPSGVVNPPWGRMGELPSIASEGMYWVCRESLDGWQRDSGEWQPAELNRTTLPESVYTQWKNGYTGAGLSLYRLLLDVHAGRFFGLPGTFAMDATAVAILYLCFSGLAVWWQRRKPRNSARR